MTLAAPRVVELAALSATLDRLESAARDGSIQTVREIIQELVPEYELPDHHSEQLDVNKAAE